MQKILFGCRLNIMYAAASDWQDRILALGHTSDQITTIKFCFDSAGLADRTVASGRFTVIG